MRLRTLATSLVAGLLGGAACQPPPPAPAPGGALRVAPPVRGRAPRLPGTGDAGARASPSTPDPLLPVWARALRQIIVGREGERVQALAPTSLAVSPHGRVALAAAFDGTVDLDGVILRARRERGAAVVHYSEDGAVLWGRTLSLRGDESVRQVAVDFAGQLLASGNLGPEAAGAFAPGLAPGEDIVLGAFSEAGEARWGARAIGDVRGGAIAVQRSNHVVFSGRFRGDASLAGQPLRSRGSFDLVIGRFAPDGTPLWIQSVGNSEDDEVLALGIGAGGEIGLCLRSGPPAGPGRLSLLRYDSDGVLRWGRDLEAADDVLRPAGLAFDSGGALLLAGTLRGATDLGSGRIEAAGGTDLVLAAYDALGQPLFARVAGGPGDEEVTALAVSYEDEVLLAGSFTDQITLGPDRLTSEGERDLLVAGFDRRGEPRWAQRFGGGGLDHGAGLVVDGIRHLVLTGALSAPATFGETAVPGPAGVIVQLLREAAPRR